ncbi:transposase [Gluconobacter oxydans]|uniref:Transposase n=1 Tax=Gluconobacter oxydans TaxID=442 RepID=A0AB35ARQ4_GLUOY|nr:transposase [Gluconobacter oxydans]
MCSKRRSKAPPKNRQSNRQKPKIRTKTHQPTVLRSLHLLFRGILPVIPSRKGRNAPQKTDWRRYRDRNRIERMFNRLKQMRRIATRYDKTALSFISFLNLADARLWIESFVNAT